MCQGFTAGILRVFTEGGKLLRNATYWVSV